MSVAEPVLPSAAVGRPTAARVASIDIFRGLTMMVMIFVNELASVTGLPWWNYHAREEQDVMTYPDLVFPFFLFIVGLSIPLAIARRLEKDPSQLALWRHILARAIGLIVLGLIFANAERADPAYTHLPMPLWALLSLLGAVLLWLAPSRDPKLQKFYRGLRIAGLVLLVAMFAIFRRTTHHGGVAWIDGSYPEILGIIGYSYFAVAVLYVPTRRWLWAPLVWFIGLTTYCALIIVHVIRQPHLPPYLWPFGAGDSASIIMAGVVTSNIFLGSRRNTDRQQSLRQKMLVALSFAVAALLAAWLLVPLGISKIRGTPTWCLVSIGLSVLVFMLLYWLCDVKRKTSWAALVKPAGENTLLTYILPDAYYYLTLLVGFKYFEKHFSAGAPGVVMTFVFTFAVLAVSGLLTRWRVRLQL
jgi:predicted acyltransferase